MASNDPLDDLLSVYDSSVLRNTKKVLRILEEAYVLTIPGLIAKSMTDRLSQSSGVEFHHGTPESELRRIASWLFTLAGEDHAALLKVARSAWKRHGREDLRIAGLIIANVNPSILSEGPWEELANLVGRSEPLEALLEVIEEIARSNAKTPADDVFERWRDSSPILHHMVLLILRVCNRRDGISELTETQKVIIQNIPHGPELMERIAEGLLNSAS